MTSPATGDITVVSQPQPTTANRSQPQPTTANHSQPQLTTANRSQPQSTEVTIMSSFVPPPLPIRSNLKHGTQTTYHSSPSSAGTDKKCSCPKGACRHCYNDVILIDNSDQHLYEELWIPEKLDSQSRLQKIEDNQIRLRLEFNQFREEILGDLRSVQTVVNEVKDLTKSLEKFVRESATVAQAGVEKLRLQCMENDDHLGKQVLDVRRDISVVASTLKRNSLTGASLSGAWEKK